MRSPMRLSSMQDSAASEVTPVSGSAMAAAGSFGVWGLAARGRRGGAGSGGEMASAKAPMETVRGELLSYKQTLKQDGKMPIAG